MKKNRFENFNPREQLRLRGQDRLECLFLDGARSRRVAFVVANPNWIGWDAGQHTPDAHCGALQPSHSRVCQGHLLRSSRMLILVPFVCENLRNR